MKLFMLASYLLIATTTMAEQTITLVKDLVITGQLSEETEKLIIRSDKGHSVIVNTGAIWDLTKEAQVIEIVGNARLIVEKGGKLIGNGNVLRFNDDAQCIIKE